jgi:clan AA aspartic protease
MGTFSLTIEIGDPQGQRFEAMNALVDTGATYTVVPASFLRRLGVTPHVRGTFALGDGRSIEMDIGRTWVRVNGQSEITLVVFGDEGVEPLLGAYTLEGLRLAADPLGPRLIPVPGRLMAILAPWSTSETRRGTRKCLQCT